MIADRSKKVRSFIWFDPKIVMLNLLILPTVVLMPRMIKIYSFQSGAISTDSTSSILRPRAELNIFLNDRAKIDAGNL